MKLSVGAVIKGGYDFTIAGSHSTDVVSFVSPSIVFTPRCGSASSTTTLTLSMATQTYTDPSGSSSWYPSGDESSSLVYQGSVTVPDLCSGGVVRFDKGGLFSAGLVSADTSTSIHVRWHFTSTGAGSWSGTSSYYPCQG